MIYIERRKQEEEIVADKELQKMNRAELIEIIYALQQKERSLHMENEELRSQLDDRLLRMEKAGSIAEAALSLNHIFEDAQQAAQQCLDSVKTAETDAAQMVAVARRKARDMISSAEERVRRADEECQAIWDQMEQDVKARKASFSRSSRNSPEKLSDRVRYSQEETGYTEMAPDERADHAGTDEVIDDLNRRGDAAPAHDGRKYQADTDAAPDEKKHWADSDVTTDRLKHRADSDVTTDRKKHRADSDMTTDRKKRRADSDMTTDRRKRRPDSDMTTDMWRRRVNPDAVIDKRDRRADTYSAADDWDCPTDIDADADDWDHLPDEA